MGSSSSTIIISISSDIGVALAKSWQNRNQKIIGTYRTYDKKLDDLGATGVELIECDLRSDSMVDQAVDRIATNGKWQTLVFLPATLKPLGPFEGSDFGQWEQSVHLNFMSQLRVLHDLLPHRDKNVSNGPSVLFFAGGGSNSAPINVSAYTISKIALTKMTEILDAEIKDTRFTIIGPGWVDTKIHKEVMEAGKDAGRHYETTLERYADNNFIPMEKVIACCDWILENPRSVVGGRNFSVANDAWGQKELTDQLADDPDMFKLRRNRNDFATSSGEN